MPEPMRARIIVNPNGSVTLPDWVWRMLYEKSGIRSRKKRHVKKAVKRMFHIAVLKGLEAERQEILLRAAKAELQNIIKEQGIEEQAKDVEVVESGA